MPASLDEFDQIWCVDAEFRAPDGERPTVICVVAHEVRRGETVCLWEDDLRRCRVPPYPLDTRSLFVAYYASAELGCHLALGWPLPAYVLDLFVEFRVLTNGLSTPCGQGLLGALAYFGIDGIDVTEKDSMRQLAMRGGPWTAEERAALEEYCTSDVRALIQLLPPMRPTLDVERALLRGRYMKAAARMEATGVPLDTEALQIVRDHWTTIQEELIARVDAHYGVYDGRTFKADRWERWLAAHDIPWPRLASGTLALDDDIFREMARAYPVLNPIRELRATLGRMRLEHLTVGSDGRNRTLLSAFRAKTGRNQPSTAKFVFGPAVWVRHFIKSDPGWGMAYVDWEQQEFGIAAALSGDSAMCAAYQSGDPYLAFARQAGAIPLHGTRTTHGAIRDAFKACALAVQYGMGADSLAMRLGRSPTAARDPLRLHRQAYPGFWAWSNRAVDYAMIHNIIFTVFGWPLHLGPGADPKQFTANPRSLRNFPAQANGAEMLRLACCLATERGVRICAPVHDAVLIEAPVHEIDQSVALTQAAMAEASAAVLDGFQLRSEAKVFRFPARYEDPRGVDMWSTVWAIIEEHLGRPLPHLISH